MDRPNASQVCQQIVEIQKSPTAVDYEALTAQVSYLVKMSCRNTNTLIEQILAQYILFHSKHVSKEALYYRPHSCSQHLVCKLGSRSPLSFLREKFVSVFRLRLLSCIIKCRICCCYKCMLYIIESN